MASGRGAKFHEVRRSEKLQKPTLTIQDVMNSIQA